MVPYSAPSATASTPTIAIASVAVTISLTTSLKEVVVDGVCCYDKKEYKKYYTLNIHKISVTRYAANHAITHWKTRIIIAQAEPSSRRIVAMAAMQGV